MVNLIEEMSVLNVMLPETIRKYLYDTHKDIIQIFLVGSRAKGTHNSESDYDLFILTGANLFEKHVLWVDGHLLDISIHTYDSIIRFMEIEQKQGSCGMANALTYGIALLSKTNRCYEIINVAQRIIQDGPPKFDLSLIKLRILGGISDLKMEENKKIQFALILSLSNHIVNFVMKAGRVWYGEGRFCVEYLNGLEAELLTDLKLLISAYCVHDNASDFINFIEGVLIKYSGDLSEEWHFYAAV